MAVQVVFSAAHLSAGALRAAGVDPNGLPMGFLALCTGEGFVPIGRDDPAKRGGNTSSTPACAVCASAAMGGFTAADDVPDAPPAPDYAVEIELPGWDLVAERELALRYGRTRGPPSFVTA